MDVSAAASLSGALAQAQTSDLASLLVTRKAIDLQAQAAQQLLQAVPAPPVNPPKLGNNVDIRV